MSQNNELHFDIYLADLPNLHLLNFRCVLCMRQNINKSLTLVSKNTFFCKTSYFESF